MDRVDYMPIPFIKINFPLHQGEKLPNNNLYQKQIICGD